MQTPIIDKILKVHTFKTKEGLILNETVTPGQKIIMECIMTRKAPIIDRIIRRIHLMASTRYGKSISIAAATVARSAIKRESWAIVAGTKEQAQIIMDYVIQFCVNDPIIKSLLVNEKIISIERLTQRRKRDHITFKTGGEIRAYGAGKDGTAVMGMGCIPQGYRVWTDKGEIEISDLIKNKQTDKVYSYNHEKEKIELQEIIEYQKNIIAGRDLIEIDLGDRKIQCTEDHPVWIEGKGYTRADKICEGDKVWVLD